MTYEEDIDPLSQARLDARKQGRKKNCSALLLTSSEAADTGSRDEPRHGEEKGGGERGAIQGFLAGANP
jgi:hypothetical protein